MNSAPEEGFWDRELDPLSWAETRAWQERRLGDAVQSTSRRSAFYRGRMHGPGAITSWEALRDIAPTTKDDLRRAQDDTAHGIFGLQQAVRAEDIVLTLSSSGTTGRPTLYALTAADVDRWADAVANMLFTAGVRATDTFMLLTGMPIVAGGFPYAEGIRRIGANLVWPGTMPADRLVRLIRQVRPTGILGTTSFATYLPGRFAELVGELPAAVGQVGRILGGGEPGLAQPEIRDAVRTGWGASHVHEIMGLCDVLAGLWAECGNEQGMHFTAARHVAVELVDPDNLEPVPWSEGATGELLYTTLDRDATPVVRFRSGDVVAVTGIGCPCGRGSPRIRCVGRSDDMLIYKGMNVFPSAVREVALAAAGNRLTSRMRIRKSHPGQVRFDHAIPVEMELADDALGGSDGEALKAEIEAAIRDQLRVSTLVEFHPAGAIPWNAYKNSLVYVGDER